VSPVLISFISLLLNILLGGGLLAVWFKYRVQMRGEDRIDFNALIVEVTRQRDAALDQVREMDQRIDNLEAEIQGLRIARDLDPFPNWVVDLQGCYRYVNREFESCFLEPDKKTYRDIIGKRHEDFWSVEFCDTLRALDASARKRPDGTARAKSRVSVPNLGECDVTVHKFPIRFKGAIVSFAGYITSIDPVERYTG
jgi:PAS domain-containing protein